jgi:hypothetical protein
MRLLNKVRKTVKNEGIIVLSIRAIRLAYRKIKPLLPERYGEYQGYKVPSHRMLETVIDVKEKNRPNYESGLIDALEKNVQEGDEVVILGGGLGVTAAKASELTGSPSRIKLFEASKKQVQKIRKTLFLNNLEGVQVEHALVGKNIDVYGSLDGAKKVRADEIPECDVLEMDIEGSEKEILENLQIRPRTIIVETHGNKGAPTSVVKEKLRNLGYRISNVRLAENLIELKEKDIRIVTAKKTTSS